jgi:hypothetical protein
MASGIVTQQGALGRLLPDMFLESERICAALQQVKLTSKKNLPGTRAGFLNEAGQAFD